MEVGSEWVLEKEIGAGGFGLVRLFCNKVNMVRPAHSDLLFSKLNIAVCAVLWRKMKIVCYGYGLQVLYPAISFPYCQLSPSCCSLLVLRPLSAMFDIQPTLKPLLPSSTLPAYYANLLTKWVVV